MPIVALKREERRAIRCWRSVGVKPHIRWHSVGGACRRRYQASNLKSQHNPLSFARAPAHIPVLMQIHASCAAREGHGVLLLGPPSSGKSDLVLRLLDLGFSLVADDRVDWQDGYASPAAALAGVLEVRGLGLIRLSHVPRARVALAVELARGDRLPQPERHPAFGVPLVRVDPTGCSAPQRVAMALDCAIGRVPQVAGAFA